MQESLRGGLTRMSYDRARQLLLVAGLTVLLVVALLLYLQRVETAEVFATLLFIPIFIGFVFWDVPGGLAAAALATVAYILMRRSAVDAVGLSHFLGLFVSRAIGF